MLFEWASSILYFASSKVKSAKAIVGIIVLVVSCFVGSSDSFAFWENDLTYEGESVYNYLQVKENEDAVYLSTNVLFGVQSVYEKSDTLTGMYYDYAMATPFMAGVNQKKNLDVLILGMGTGTFATQCDRYFDGMTMEGVEIDEDITELATEYFHLSKDIPVYTYDGRAYLNAVDKKYDVIMVDAYQDITIPFQMSSVEFFQLVREHLNEDGVMVVNMNMRGQEEGNINQYLADTIASVFKDVYTIDVKGSTNRELFASNTPDMLTVLEKNLALEQNSDLLSFMEETKEYFTAYQAGSYIMTDDKAPVELLGMQVIDDLIGDEVAYYKNLYKTEGFRGLLEVF